MLVILPLISSDLSTSQIRNSTCSVKSDPNLQPKNFIGPFIYMTIISVVVVAIFVLRLRVKYNRLTAESETIARRKGTPKWDEVLGEQF